MTCTHENFCGDLNVGRIKLTEDGPVEAFVADVSIRCADCGIDFEVCWTEPADPNTIPLSLELQKRRPWVSGLGTIMGWVLRPLEKTAKDVMPNVDYTGSA